jgi:large subunit ribosomal protein L6e
MEDFSLNLS